MEKPQSVNTAILTIWGALALSALVAVLDRKFGGVTYDGFMGDLFSMALFSVLPYKMSQGRNWSRYFFGVSVFLSLAVLLAGAIPGVSKLALAASWLLLPIQGWVTYLLFQPESNAWFEGKGLRSAGDTEFPFLHPSRPASNESQRRDPH